MFSHLLPFLRLWRSDVDKILGLLCVRTLLVTHVNSVHLNKSLIALLQKGEYFLTAVKTQPLDPCFNLNSLHGFTHNGINSVRNPVRSKLATTAARYLWEECVYVSVCTCRHNHRAALLTGQIAVAAGPTNKPIAYLSHGCRGEVPPRCADSGYRLKLAPL